jgi:hypothetical protein
VSGPATDNLEAVKTWLLVRKPGLWDIDLDVDLIENRIIDSLDLTEFLYFLSGITRRDLFEVIKRDAHWPEQNIRTLRLIRDNVLITALDD